MEPILYAQMLNKMHWAYRKNYDVITEYGFYFKLPPKLQTELVN